MEPFSILMSIYIKERPEYVEECFQSLLKQTIKANEWVIVEDGPLSLKMYNLLDRYEKEYPGLIKRIPLERNQGLGLALRVGVLECSHELIARMDTDDIAKEDRFEKQLLEFKKDPKLGICGSNIDEFEIDPKVIVSKRTVPTAHEDIVKYQKYRDAFNHMTVMYKRSLVLSAGNYEACPLMEDTYLWARMILNHTKCMNINESLVYARVGKDMYARRGGFDYYRKYKNGRKKLLMIGYITKKEYLSTILIQFIVSLIPGRLRGFVFKRILHR